MKKIKIILICVFMASSIAGHTQGGCDDCFVSTWDSSFNGGDRGDSDREITLAIYEGAYDVDINNDGTFEYLNLSGRKQRIDCGSPGIYTIAIRPNVSNTKKELRIRLSDLNIRQCELKSIEKWGSIVWTSMGNAFNRCQSLTTIADDAGVPNLTKVTSMSSMFSVARNFNADLSKWDVSNVTSMGNMFGGAHSFTSDLSSWDVSNATSMFYMFRDAISFTSDLGSWNVSQVTDMQDMFVIDNFAPNPNSSFKPEHYDALLIGWASLPTLHRPIFFRAPKTTYCKGKQARELLRFTRGWIIQGDLGEDCSIISVDEEFLSNTKIYPNPTRGKLTIESSFLIDKLELYNILGAKIFSVSKTNALDLASLRQGIYILKVFSEDRVISKKIIKD